MNRSLRAAAALLACLGAIPAQNVESLALPDLLDSRTTQLRLTARLAELNREAALQTSLNNHAAAANIAAAVAKLQGWQSGAIPVPPGSGVEVHAVSFYEGAAGTPRTARVSLTRTLTPVVLFLNAYSPITWTLDLLPPGTLLLGVLLVSYDPQTIVGVPTGIPVVQIDRTAGGTYYGRPPDLTGRLDLASACLTKLGLLPTTFQGIYTAPATALEVGPGAGEWRDQWVLAEAERQGLALNGGTRAKLTATYAPQIFFPLLTPAIASSGSSVLVVANPFGVQSGGIVSLSAITCYDILPTSAVYVLRSRTPSILLPGLTTTAIPPDALLPPFSNVNGQTLDLVRARMLYSSFGGVGYLYAYDLITSKWASATSLNNVDLGAIVHHPVHDAIFAYDPGTFGGGVHKLRRYDAAGAAGPALNLGLSTWGTPSDSFQMYVLGANVAVVGPARRVFGAPVRHVFVIDPTTGDIVCASYLVG